MEFMFLLARLFGKKSVTIDYTESVLCKCITYNFRERIYVWKITQTKRQKEVFK